jgi:diaminopropionate ammonia-lyase
VVRESGRADVDDHARRGGDGVPRIVAWQIPQWIVDGYSTLFTEADTQLAAAGAPAPDLIAVPIGVGSLAQAAVRHYRARSADRLGPVILGVEPIHAPAIITSLQAGRLTSVPTHPTIMAGLNCGTPSHGAWPDLLSGLDAATTVSDQQAATAVHDLETAGIDAGPCGAATLAATRTALPNLNLPPSNPPPTKHRGALSQPPLT